MTRGREFDAAHHLDNAVVIAAYLKEALETGDKNLIARAIETIARALREQSLLPPKTLGRLRTACEKLGPWMSAALDDPQVCAEMKDAIKAWFSALEKAERDEFERQMTIARRIMKKDRNALRELAKR